MLDAGYFLIEYFYLVLINNKYIQLTFLFEIGPTESVVTGIGNIL